MAHVLEIIRPGLKIKYEVDNSQLPVFAHEYFSSQHLVETRDVNEAKFWSYVSFIYKNI